MQFCNVLVRPGGLDIAEQALECLVVVGADFERRIVGAEAEAAAKAAAVARLRPRTGAGISAGVGRLRRVAALPPGHCQPHHEHDEHDLDDQAQDRRQAAEATEQAATEQHAQKTCAEEADPEHRAATTPPRCCRGRSE